MIRLLSRRHPRSCSSIRQFGRTFSSSKHEPSELAHQQAEAEGYLHPDWFRTPLKTDGPRCIAPDYPETPFQSYQARDPYKKYDDQQRRRDFNEPVNERFDMLSAQSFDIEQTYSMRYMLSSLGIAAGVTYAVIQAIQSFDEKEGWRTYAVPRELPYAEKYIYPKPAQP